MKRLVLFFIFCAGAGVLAADDTRLTQGASGALPTGTSTQACKCTIDEKFISEREAAFAKAQADKMMKGFEEWKSRQPSKPPTPTQSQSTQ